MACGSSHSIAWTLQDSQGVSKQEPVIFSVVRDPLGSSALGLYDDEKTLSSRGNKGQDKNLRNIVMSLESNTAKQQALQHVLNAMHIQQARQTIVKALCSHTNISHIIPTKQTENVDSPPEGLKNLNTNQISNKNKDGEIALGGGEAPASIVEIAALNVRINKTL